MVDNIPMPRTYHSKLPDVETVKRHLADGFTPSKIAMLYDCSTAAFYLYCRRHEIDYGVDARTAERDAITQAMFDRHVAGESVETLAKEMGVKASALYERWRRRGMKIVKPKIHGTRGSYVKGCHCTPCTRANADYQQEYMRSRRATS